MKEISLILSKLRETRMDGRKAVLATVVDVQGSSYRLPGAKMLITESGASFGTVSGGCLETDVMERAGQVWQTGAPQIFVYDTTKDEGSVFGLNMGCRGVIRVLLEPVAAAAGYLSFWESCFTRREKGLIATCIGGGAEDIGRRAFLSQSGDFTHSLQRNGFLAELLADAGAALESGKSSRQTYKTLAGEIEFFVETVAPPVSLVVFGAGADAVPLAEIGKQLGWQISVADHRPAFLSTDRFPAADRLMLYPADDFPENLPLDEKTAAVIMTHNYERDRRILPVLLKSEAFYVGALGPKKRTEKLLAELRDAGESFDATTLARLYAPVGLDIGAETPEAIALAIAAEIQSVLRQREGGFLRRRQGSIYGRNE